jgi:tRNA-Thr(GGU) m(6)t(6)A37 methyltransferase TsaA
MDVKPALDVNAEPVEGVPGVTVRWLWVAADDGPTFSLRLFEVEPGASTPYHQHAHEHEVYILNGQAILRSESQEYALRVGDTALVMPHEQHQFSNDSPTSLQFLCAIPQIKPPLNLSAQVSLYPLKKGSLSPAIDSALDIFRRRGLLVNPGPMSTLISGDCADIFKALQVAFEKTSNEGEDLVMAVTLSNTCPSIGTMSDDAISFRAIGHVENEFEEPVSPDTMLVSQSRITINPDLMLGLKFLEQGSRVLVVFYFHQSKGYELLQHPRGDKSRPKRGVFTLHSPNRPNPIGVTEVEILSVEGNVLTVGGLDAINGTPVLDLKQV